jgi:hypothetical protein
MRVYVSAILPLNKKRIVRLDVSMFASWTAADFIVVPAVQMCIAKRQF